MPITRAQTPDRVSAVGGSLILIFHTPAETERLYPELSESYSG